MGKNFIIVGGTKGLGKEIVNLISQPNNNVICIGRTSSQNENPNVNFLRNDLEKITFNDYISIFKSVGNIDGICFAQRYRSKTNETNKFINEAKIMIEPIAICMNALIKYQSTEKIDKDSFTKVIVIGSSYSSRVGYDQGWEYHVSKAAQLSLVRYFSIRSKGNYSINLLSPATFIKEGANDYWSKTETSQNWKKFPSQGLINAKDIAKSIIQLMDQNSPFISGNEIYIDGGLFNLYPDQITDLLD